MLDILITYVNFLILSIGYIVKRFAFFPPNPPHYKSKKTDRDDEDDILFLVRGKNKEKKYVGIKFKLVEYRFIKIINKTNDVLPLLLLIPPFHIPVCIIYSHGNSGDLGACILEYYDIAINTNCLVLSFEYPGYGECMNQPLKESLFFRNMKIAYYFVRKILNYKPEQIILYGFSMGTGVMLDFACHKENPSAGMILQSPFLSIFRTLYNVKNTPYFDLFNNCDKAKYLNTKTFFIHGTKDTFVPYIHGKILAKLIPQEYYYDFLTIQDADHNNLFKNNKDLIFKKIRQFIKDCTGYYTDFSKISLDESSSNSTVNNNDNNVNPNDTSDKINDENKDTLNNMDNLSDKEIIRQKNKSFDTLIVKQIGNNNKNNHFIPNYLKNIYPKFYGQKINNSNNFPNLPKTKDNLSINFFDINNNNLLNKNNNNVKNNTFNNISTNNLDK